MITAVVIHERPSITESERIERGVNVGRAKRRVGGNRVQDRVVDALAGVLDVEDLVSQGAKPEQIHQGAPRNTAERIPRDDAGEQDAHIRGDYRTNMNLVIWSFNYLVIGLINLPINDQITR